MYKYSTKYTIGTQGSVLNQTPANEDGDNILFEETDNDADGIVFNSDEFETN